MAFYLIPQRYKLRRGTTTELYQRNEVLMDGEMCVEQDDATGEAIGLKVGNGALPWNDLDYVATGSASGSQVFNRIDQNGDIRVDADGNLRISD
jgi:hypothetical protein